MDSECGEIQKKGLAHREEAENFFRALAGTSQKVCVGMEASGHFNESEMPRSSECMDDYAPEELDTTDIVREAINEMVRRRVR